ncbi:MAG: hypothetical protein LAO21_20900 [Acidobacteriia bacterium]|nr:hypothetical protein [Terriglobia bacterium]
MRGFEVGWEEKVLLEEAGGRNPQAQAPAGKNARRGYQSGLRHFSPSYSRLAPWAKGR